MPISEIELQHFKRYAIIIKIKKKILTIIILSHTFFSDDFDLNTVTILLRWTQVQCTYIIYFYFKTKLYSIAQASVEYNAHS